MENPSASKYPATDRSDDVGGSVRNGVRLDGKWEHQRLRKSTHECKPLGVGMLFIRSLNASANLLII